jgi:hypothetical protein
LNHVFTPLASLMASQDRETARATLSSYPVPKKAACDMVHVSSFERSANRDIGRMLADRRMPGLEALAKSLKLSPGDVRRIMDLAGATQLQSLVMPVKPGTRLRPNDGRGAEVTCVGCKPRGFMEDWQIDVAKHNAMRGGPFRRARHAQDEPLVWTVDPASSRPGISQSRLSDWTIVGDKEEAKS